MTDVAAQLRSIGINARADWLNAAMRSRNVLSDIDKIILAFINYDMCYSSDGALPQDLQDDLDASSTLEGPLVLQIEELVNVGTSLENRSSDANCALKLFLTDGRRRLVGFEVARIAGLGWRTPPGTKVLVRRAPLRRGLLLLSPANCKLLGGRPLDRAPASTPLPAQPIDSGPQAAHEDLGPHLVRNTAALRTPSGLAAPLSAVLRPSVEAMTTRVAVVSEPSRSDSFAASLPSRPHSDRRVEQSLLSETKMEIQGEEDDILPLPPHLAPAPLAPSSALSASATRKLSPFTVQTPRSAIVPRESPASLAPRPGPCASWQRLRDACRSCPGTPCKGQFYCKMESITGFKPSQQKDTYGVAGLFSDLVDAYKCAISSGICESILGMSVEELCRRLNQNPLATKDEKVLARNKLCGKFSKIEGVCVIETECSLVNGSDEAVFTNTVVEYRPSKR